MPISGRKATLNDADGALYPITSTECVVDADGNSLDYLLGCLVSDNAGSHNSIYRGKYLGTQVTAAQWSAISAGTFRDLYIGDYWTISGVNYRIAAFDYYYNTGDTNCTTHHAVIVPDTSLYSYAMNDTNTVTGGYAGSKMRTDGLTQAKSTVNSAFGSSHVLSHRIRLTNAASNGEPSGSTWYDSEVDLMNEQMVYGGTIFAPSYNSTIDTANQRVDKSQLPLFAYRPDLVCIRVTYWLRDVSYASGFSCVSDYGDANAINASHSRGVRPVFCIK